MSAEWSTTTPSPLPTIAGYRIVRIIGRGGMATTYLAEHEASGLDVAIKVLDPEHASDVVAVRRFVRGGELVADINHPYVITLHEVGELPDGRPYQVMEYCPAEELSRMMARRERFAAEELWPYVQQICLGLHVAHERGVVHRDLKPSNILVLSTSPVHLKLIDFGVAKATASETLTREHFVVGSPHFIAPEQLGGARIDRRADIYSLGVLLYWMLSGGPPFHHERTFDILKAHLCQRPKSLRTCCPELPPELAWIVLRCLEKDPDQRPPTTKIVARHYLRGLERAGRVSAAALSGIGTAWGSGIEVTARYELTSSPPSEGLQRPTAATRLIRTPRV